MDFNEMSTYLRHYQQEAIDFMVSPKPYVLQPNTKGCALEYDDMGLGKTLTTMVALRKQDAFPCLIICPKFALMVWQSELLKWLGIESTIYTGKPKEREEQWAEFINSGCKVLITNYALMPEVALRSGIELEVRTAINSPTPGSFKWLGIVWDEAHMGGLFNHKTASYKASLKLARIIPTRYVLTGTPFRQGVVDLFGPLSLVDPAKFKSYWSYVNTFCIVIKTPFGKSIERNPLNITTFRAMLAKYMIRRVKTEVLQELPGKLRQTLPVLMNKEQQELYDELTAELIAMIPETGELLITPNQMTLIVRQRQILACPQVLGLKYRGAAIDTLLEHSHLSLDEDDKPIIVYTPFSKALPYLREAFLEEYGDELQIYEIRGKLTAAEFGASWMGFQNDKHKKRVMFCVIKSGASFQATAACTGYFLGYEYDFTLNEQAEDRMHRMGQKDFVNIYYLMHKNTVDEQVSSILNEKKTSSDWVIGSEKQYLTMLKKHQGQSS